MATIQFLCPQGHLLTTEANRAGTEARCPSCGTAMLVPDAPPMPNLSPAVFHFYCPQGHKLNGPVSLQGRPGKCPHCGSRFMIPGPLPETASGGPSAMGAPPETPGQSEIPDPSADHDAFPTSVSASAPTATFSANSIPGTPAPPDATSVPAVPPVPWLERTAGAAELERTTIVSGEDRPTGAGPSLEAPWDQAVEKGANGGGTSADLEAPAPPGLENATPSVGKPGTWLEFVAWVWRHRAPDQAVEILLRDGERLRPSWYASELSHADFGVFAMEDGNGGYTVQAVPWSDVQRLSIRGLPSLPPGFR